MNIRQNTNDPSFYYDNALSHCTSNFIATSTHYTTLEYDECIVVWFSKYVDMPPRVQSIYKYN